MPHTKYARCGDLSLAYQVGGEGPIDLVITQPFVSHLELTWTVPDLKAWLDRLGSFCRFLIFDKAGVGLSDPVPKVRSLDERTAEIEAVMDAAGFGSAVLLGMNESGPASIMFAATRPERVNALILSESFAQVPIGWEDADRDPDELAEQLRSLMGDAYAPTPEQIARLQPLIQAIRADGWGTGEVMRHLAFTVTSMSQLGMLERMTVSPGMARATLESMFRIDVRSVLPAIHVPTLVINITDSPIPAQMGRYLADNIADASFVEIENHDPDTWLVLGTDAIEEFLTGAHTAPSASQRALRTVLFTDIVASTDRAIAMGDARWRALLERFAEVTIRVVDFFGGTIVKGTGDGHLVTFDGPTQAIRSAESLQSEVEALAVEMRAGIHTGECELIGDDIGGVAVHIAARIMAEASPGEILVSSSIRDLVVGSGIGFEDRGLRELKGVPGEWQLLAVDPQGAHPGSTEAVLVSIPTPSARSGMRRSDRAVAALARYTPGLLRGVARVG